MKDSADSIAFSIASMRELETFSASDSRFASIGASVKILASFVFILCVVSFGVYDLRVLLFFVFPAILWIAVRPPAKIFFNRLLIVLPFVLFTGISNLIFDNSAVELPFGFEVRGGAVSFFTLLCKAVLCVGAALFLVLTTPINAIAGGLRRFKLPCVLVLQTVLTLRYLEVMLDEAGRMHCAYSLRAPNLKGIKFTDWHKIAARLFLRSLDRAENIYSAMLCRGFCARKTMEFYKSKESFAEIAALVCFAFFCFFLRFSDWIF